MLSANMLFLLVLQGVVLAVNVQTAFAYTRATCTGGSTNAYCTEYLTDDCCFSRTTSDKCCRQKSCGSYPYYSATCSHYTDTYCCSTTYLGTESCCNKAQFESSTRQEQELLKAQSDVQIGKFVGGALGGVGLFVLVLVIPIVIFSCCKCQARKGKVTQSTGNADTTNGEGKQAPTNDNNTSLVYLDPVGTHDAIYPQAQSYPQRNRVPSLW